MASWSVVTLSELEGACRLDAEYYSPDLQELAAKLAPISVPLACIAGWITQGPNPRFLDAGRASLNGRNVAPGWVDEDSPNFVSDEEFEALRRFKVRAGDILVTLKGLGSIGQSGLVPSKIDAIFSRDLGLVRLKPSSSFLPEYVFAYFSSRAGRKLIDRGISGGTGQMTLATSYLRSLPIPKAGQPFQEGIKKLVRRAESKRARSKWLYLEAERMLLEDLAWHSFLISQPGWWTVQLPQARDAHRMDAEHFQPKYDKLIAHLSNHTGKASPLGSGGTYIKRGLQPEYADDGVVMVVNSQHLGRYHVNVEGTERADSGFWEGSERCRLKERDVLLYSTGAYVGRTNVWLEDARAVANNHVTIIRPAGLCDPLYLSVFLNSPPGLLQAEKWASGSGQREVYPDDIARIVIYLPGSGVQSAVADLVRKSYSSRREAAALLDKALQMVDGFLDKETPQASAIAH